MSRLCVLASLLFVACGQSSPDSSDESETGGSAGSGSAGTNGGGASAGAGSVGKAGSESGGAPSAEAGAGSGAEPGASGGAPDELVDCDPRKILCRAAPPECGTMQVPSVEGTCYGPCVDIERCACSSAAACPEEEQYTCWSGMHCGPYVR